MSRLFIELYMDEDVDVLVAQLLRSRGFEGITTVEAGRLGESDSSQLAYAADQHRTLLTHNRADFERLAEQYFTTQRDHAGIIIAVRRPPRQIAQRLLSILNHVMADEMHNQVRYL